MAEEKKQISFGRLVKKADFQNSSFVPDEVRKTLKDTDFYLFIYIPSDEIIKLSIFPCGNVNIQKILIRLKEFSPELVKGISDVLKNFELGDSTIHTTGLCFSGINCFYETYLDSTKMKDKNISIEEIKKEFLAVPRVVEVHIVDVEQTNL